MHASGRAGTRMHSTDNLVNKPPLSTGVRRPGSRMRQASGRTPAVIGSVFLATGLLLGLPSLAATADDGPFELTVKPGGFGERCLRLERDGALSYEFSADGDVDFNLHYHRGQEIFYPVRSAAVRSDRSRFIAPAADDYCLMWENRGAMPVRIEGRMARQR